MLQRLDVQSKTEPIRSVIPPRVDPSAKLAGGISLRTAVIVYAGIEFLSIAVSAFAAHILYQFIVLPSWNWQLTKTYVLSAVILATLVLLFSLAFHNFSAIRRQARHIFVWRGFGAVALSFSAFLTILVFLQLGELYSRGTLILQVVCIGLTVALSRSLFYSWLQSAMASNRIEARRIVLIGDNSHRSAFSKRLKESGIRTVGSFGYPQDRGAKRAIGANPRIHELIAGIRSLLPDDVAILAKRTITATTLELASTLAEIPAGVHIVPVDELNLLTSAQITPFGSLNTIQLFHPPLSTFDLFIKRAFDLVFASISLILLSPLFLIILLAIKLDSPGPISFRQVRHGFNNEEIRVFKFRSMTCLDDGGEFVPAVENDPRVTRIGRIMRQTNIDELPQLINVLHGEMSIVGPRPHAPGYNLFKDVIPPFSRRHKVKPGITGWAQVNGFRGVTDTLEKMQRRIECDLYYIDNWSFLLDLKIIIMTVLSRKAFTNAR